MPRTALRRILSAAALAVLLLALPTPARAGDCATDFVVCLTDLGGYATSLALHEMECWGEYLDCVATLLILF